MTARASLKVPTRYWIAAGALLVGCSLQNFDYLSEGPTPADSDGGSAGTSGGAQNQAGTGSGGTTGGQAGGDGNEGASGDEGGAPGGGGEDASGGASGHGGTNNGGTNSGGTNNGGTNNGGTNNGGTGAVGELVNPSFESASTFGWTVEPPQALSKKYIFVQWPVGAGSVPDGDYELSTWHETDEFTLEIYQTILGLEDGTYTFKGYFSRGDGFDAVTLFARNCGGTDPEPVPVPLTTASQWLAVEVAGIEVVGGSCEVGMSMESNPGNWLNADLFTFEREEQTEE